MTSPDQGNFTLLAPTGEVIARGSMAAVTEPIFDSTSRAEAMALCDAAGTALDLIEQQQEQAEALRVRELQALCDGIATLSRRLDAAEQQREAEQQAAAAAEAQRIADAIATLPDPDDPGSWDGPTAGGELRPLPASAPEHQRQLEAIEDQGSLPESLLRGAPPEQGNRAVLSRSQSDPAQAGYPPDPPQEAQPVAVSLNEE